MDFISPYTAQFKLPFEPFGLNDTERAIEIPWALSCIRTDEKVLDIGYAYAEPRYMDELLKLPLVELWGVDYVMKDEYPSMKKVKADFRDLSLLPRNFFDTILCVSTIEHVGFNNDIYFKEPNFVKDPDADLVAVAEMVKTLKPKGKLIITVPFGKLVDYGWFMQYDSMRITRLISHSKCYVVEFDFFIYKNHGWNKCKEAELAEIEYKSNDAPAAAGLCCAMLVKKDTVHF